MKVYCAGFNLYGQFVTVQDVCIDTFTKTDYESLTDLDICHEFIIAKMNGKLYLHGYINRQSHQATELRFEDDEVLQVSVSDNNALFLTKTGKIWRLVENVSYSEQNYSLEIIPDFIKVEFYEQNVTDVVSKISCGHCFSCAFTKNGSLFNIPTKLKCANLNIDYMCSGREHCLVLSQNGDVYSFGSGSRGQLGHGDLQDHETPKLIEALAGIKIVKIACGSWHSAAISEDGDLYLWGCNNLGQLGLRCSEKKTATVSIVAVPQVLNFEKDVVNVACGSRHTIILLEDNKLFGSGWNKYNQLGFKGDENIHKMTFLYDFGEEKIVQLKCGPWNSVVTAED